MTQRAPLQNSNSKRIQTGTVNNLRAKFEAAPIQGQPKKPQEKNEAKTPNDDTLEQLNQIEKLQQLLAILDLDSQRDETLDKQAIFLVMTLLAQDETEHGDKNMFQSAESIIRELGKNDFRFKQMAMKMFGNSSVDPVKKSPVPPQPTVSGKSRGLVKTQSASST